MNSTRKYFRIGLWIFAFLTLSILTGIYATYADIVILSYLCIIADFILLLCLLFVLMQSKTAIDELNDEIMRFREREKTNVQNEQQTSENNFQNMKVFKIDEVLAGIMPSADTQFNSAETYTEKVLQNIAKGLDIVQGLVFVYDETDQMFKISGLYAYYSEEQPRNFPLGETLSGQVAKNKKMLNLKELPAGYVTVLSGLGKSAPYNLIIAPIIHDGNSIGVIELASFKSFDENEELLVGKICESMANRLNELRS